MGERHSPEASFSNVNYNHLLPLHRQKRVREQRPDFFDISEVKHRGLRENTGFIILFLLGTIAMNYSLMLQEG